MTARRAGGCLLFLVSLILLLLIVGFALGTAAQGYEAPWISVPIGLPLVAALIPTAWALWAGRRVRPVAGMALAGAALGYGLSLTLLTWGIAGGVAKRTDWLAGTAFIALLPFPPGILLFAFLAWLLLRRQGIPAAPFLFLGIALSFAAAWAGLWVYFPRLWGDPEALPVHAFFLIPALLVLGMGMTLGRARR